MPILDNFQRIIENEYRLRHRDGNDFLQYDEHVCYIHDHPDEFYNTTDYLLAVAESSLVPRSYNKYYDLDSSNIIYESVGAHTNLVCAILDQALQFRYGANFGGPNSLIDYTTDGFTYREVMEAARIHDLPENVTGDMPDNGSHNDDDKLRFEYGYYSHILSKYPRSQIVFTSAVERLLKNKHNHESVSGRMLHLADKAAALIITLCLDRESTQHLYKSPQLSRKSSYCSDRDHAEMNICDYEENGCYRASEMWTIDFFKMRKISELDATFFYIAIIVMATLICHGEWYNWRERDYET